jgi:nicotinamide-nucleotide amidase
LKQTLKVKTFFYSFLTLSVGCEDTTATIEIICVGNELLIGKVVNTNASWLGKRATSLGGIVKRITVCPDDMQEMAMVFREVISRKPDFIVSTGGLGPTFDDKTLQGISEALGVKVTVNEEALRMVKEKYAAYAKAQDISPPEMTGPRLKMAAIPDGTVPVQNPIGSAPGIRLDLKGSVLFALPGVPREMEAIFEASIAPLLRQASGDVCFYEKSVFAGGIMESNLAPLIDIVMHDNPLVYVKSHVQREEGRPHMELHFYTSGKTSEHCELRLEKAAAQLSGLLQKAGGKVHDKE